ncbi:MAG TPA: glycosyltransferase, partial [Alphaproteobacteria bacterium]|nr:glycosyltransferase [Alphaproteobacteria bacterium]
DTSGFTLHQLPPVRSPDDTYTRLVDDQGREAAPALHAERSKALVRILDEVQPDALMVEMFPFGRSQIATEMIDLIEAARARTPRPLILSSVRDIVPAKRTLERYEEMADQVNAWFDAVLVHGDAALIAFDKSFPPSRRIADRIRYTGYVLSPAQEPATNTADGEVVVSAGGGAFGAKLLHAALQARSSGILDRELAEAPWRLLTGPNIPDPDWDAINKQAGDGITVERMRADFRSLLARARLSVSLCGYNTALEVLEAGVPAVMVPAGSGRQNEQRRRAQALLRHGLVQEVPEAELTASTLAAAINRAAAPRPPAQKSGIRIDLSGAGTTRRLIQDMLAGARPEKDSELASPA